ncbi:MAG: hypothetical protein LAQ69_21525 [Acidobacteriia bacterium]|nr:hypothetical protein [Terriglobia bacterium]
MLRFAAPPRQESLRAKRLAFFLPEGVRLDHYEQEIVREAFRGADGNRSQAARMPGLTRSSRRYRLTQMGLEAWFD